jgi:hypothetical protein
MRRFLTLLMLSLCLAAPAWAQSQLPLTQFSGPWLPAETENNVNVLIRAINTIFLPLFPTVSGAVNFPIFTAAATGGIATISTGGSSGDANASLGINPNGNGNIVLFANAVTDTGLLQFGNSASFQATTTLAQCPGTLPNKAPLGMSATITGYIQVQDWLGRSHGLPAC